MPRTRALSGNVIGMWRNRHDSSTDRLTYFLRRGGHANLVSNEEAKTIQVMLKGPSTTEDIRHGRLKARAGVDSPDMFKQRAHLTGIPEWCG